MRILLVKTSSLGDVIHNLPVLSDIRRQWPDATVDWCVEENFAAIPRLHPALGAVWPVAIRRWRKHLLQATTWREIAALRHALRGQAYDWVIDTQGLLKSALLARWAPGQHAGYAADSAREPLAARFYEQHFSVSRALHAVERNRQLAAAALGYSLVPAVDYGIAPPAPCAVPDFPGKPTVVLLTATSRDDKLWPETQWQALGQALQAQGFQLLLPAGSAPERARAARLAAAIPEAQAMPPLSIPQLATLLGQARAVVGLDTGLTHLAVALRVPTVAIYTATDPGLTGVYGSGFYRNLGGQAQCPTVAAVLGELQAVLA
ncbi:MAG: lipopolysaccharide heptosyltransferase I [Dechloromonas sp.]|nr:lipopolysaccharide heptosyltransferase I [Dechloromonas sp.]